MGAGVVRIDTDDVEPVEVAKLHARYAFQLTTEDVEQLLCWLLRDVRHETRSSARRCRRTVSAQGNTFLVKVRLLNLS